MLGGIGGRRRRGRQRMRWLDVCNIALYSIRPCFHHQSHPQLGVVALAPTPHSFWSYFSTDLQQHIGYLPTWGVHISWVYKIVGTDLGTKQYSFINIRASQVVLVVKNLPANAGDTIDTGSILSHGVSLEEEMATYSSMLVWKTPWTEEPGGLQSMWSQSWT